MYSKRTSAPKIIGIGAERKQEPDSDRRKYMSKMLLTLTSIAVCLLAILGDGGSCHTKKGTVNKAPVEINDRLANGVWGGQHIRAEVTDSGTDIEFDCAHGTIDQPIVLDAKGSFDVKGKFTPERGGPIRRDEKSNDRLVRYVGQVKDQAMTLTIRDAGTKETIDSFSLTHGSDGRIRKCR